MADRAARPSGDLPDRRQRPARGADPRDGELVAPLGVGGAAARRSLHRDRARPDRPRRLGHAPRRLLARRARGQHPRPARSDRRRQRDDRRPLARRRRGDAVLLPVPPAHRAARARVERRARPRGEPAAAQRRAARRVRAARARCPPAFVLSMLRHIGERLQGRGSGKGVYLRAIARALQPLERPGRPQGLPPDAPLGDRRPRPARQRRATGSIS